MVFVVVDWVDQVIGVNVVFGQVVVYGGSMMF